MRKNIPSEQQPPRGFSTMERGVDHGDRQLREPMPMRSFVVGSLGEEAFEKFLVDEGQEVVGYFDTENPTFRDYARIYIGRQTASMVCEVGYGATEDILPRIVSER